MNIPHAAHEHPISPTDPNRGLNVRVYLAIVAAAAVFIVLILWVTVFSTHSSRPATPTTMTIPSSSLTTPKPSPLHVASVKRERVRASQ